MFELRQELTPKRPLRSEVEKEKRLSRPPSGQFSRPPSLTVILRTTNSSGNSSNRDSVGTTDSSVSEEDVLPPPLPVKLREADYCNLPNSTCENTSFLYTYRNSLRSSSVHPKLPPPEPIDKDDPPPLPPPKPPKNKCL